jgi:L-alanine-DL-glutamate epimerase-like enolase superfamily enzyme
METAVSVDAQPRLKLKVEIEKWELISPFRITGYVFTHLDCVVATVSDGEHEGRGEAAGVYYFGDTPDKIVPQIEAVRAQIEAGISREALRELLPAGGARNAVDCALWELEARRAGEPAWRLAGLKSPTPLLTTYTLGADTPQAMAAAAVGPIHAPAKALKMKLLGDGLDAERVTAVRAVRPDAWIGVDANQGFTPDSLTAALPAFLEARVELIEQPYKIGEEHLLEGWKSPIPIAADESVQTLKDVAGLVGRFDVMNIKLDKCGGLTEGLLMAKEAKRLGLKVMVGNMTGTSVAMAPAMLVGQYCDVVDLDGPLFLKQDRVPAIVYDNGLVHAPDGVWG